ncbi:MAG: uroporphyrinogen decarboxylase family protein [Rectinemataceae bacterium]
MSSRDRVLAALSHRESDRLPLDIGSVQVTGIHVEAYRGLRNALGLPETESTLCDSIQRLALPEEDFIARLGVDIRGLYPRNSHNWNVVEVEAGDYWEYHDEWGITHRRPRPGGLYHSVSRVPLPGPGLTARDIEKHPWPDLGDPRRIEGLKEKALAYRNAGFAVLLKDPFAGIFEMSQRIIGMEELLMTMAAEPEVAEALFDKMLQLKLAFWEMALPVLGDLVDVVSYADDYGSQSSQIISPRMFRELVKPRVRILFDAMKRLAPTAWRFFHSCGNVRPLLPDFIEIGTQILNPVHISATGMEPVALKRDFGADLVFWGGGVDTQGVLPRGSPDDVRDDVRKNIEALAPGGGFVFSTVHNIQSDVPPANIIAMVEALRGFVLPEPIPPS